MKHGREGVKEDEVQSRREHTKVSSRKSEKENTVKPRIADTSEKPTPRLCGHFLKSQRLALFYLYKLPLEMWTPHYFVLRTAPCAPPYTTLYKPHPIIRTFPSAARKWPLPDLPQMVYTKGLLSVFNMGKFSANSYPLELSSEMMRESSTRANHLYLYKFVLF